jgi:beta-N-acetylhexosaminidase
VGQRLVASFRGTATPPAALVRRIRRGEVAGVVLFAENASTLAQARRLTRRLQAIERPAALRDAPLLIMVDQEGGLVQRITDAPPGRGALAAARAGDAGAIEAEGRRTGRALRGAGITVDLAPVADVPRPGSAMLREQRTYGTTAAQVRSLRAALRARAGARRRPGDREALPGLRRGDGQHRRRPRDHQPLARAAAGRRRSGRCATSSRRARAS